MVRKTRLLRHLALGALIAALGTGLLRADLEKEKAEKEQPAPDKQSGELGGGAEDEHEKLHQQLMEDGKVNLKKVTELMKKIQDDLNAQKTGAPTQEQQKEVVKRIQDVIDKLKGG